MNSKDDYISVPMSVFNAMNDLVLKRSVQLAHMREQLCEANKIIKYYAEMHGKLKACDYLNKWGVE